MKIIVNNQHEADLIRRFLEVGHEFSITDLMEQELLTIPEDERELTSEDYRILADAVFWEGPKIQIDPSEEELRFQDDDFVTGTCVYCGTFTMGTGDGMDVLTYSEWVKMNNEENRKKWRCEDCHRRMCGRCGERTYTDDEYGECNECLSKELEHGT